MAQNKYMAQSVYSPHGNKAKKTSSRAGAANRDGRDVDALRREFIRYKRETDIELEELRKKAGKT